MIYQAANAVYLGLTDARGPGQYIVNGQQLHPRTVYRRFGSARHEALAQVDAGYTRIQRVKKHRYMFILVGGMRRKALLEKLGPLIIAPPRRVEPTFESLSSP